MGKPLFVGVALLALVATASGVAMQTAKRYEFTNCAAAGSTAQSVTGGNHLLRVTEADSRLCINETANPDGGTVCGPYDGGVAGEMFPLGTVMVLTIPGSSSVTKYVSCSSSTATGDVHLTYAP
jgi:hypothetical protein